MNPIQDYTISRGHFDTIVMMYESGSISHREQIEAILRRFGVHVEDEPTNAEKIEQLIWDAGEDLTLKPATGADAVKAWAEYLDSNGVKAGN